MRDLNQQTHGASNTQLLKQISRVGCVEYVFTPLAFSQRFGGQRSGRFAFSQIELVMPHGFGFHLDRHLYLFCHVRLARDVGLLVQPNTFGLKLLNAH